MVRLFTFMSSKDKDMLVEICVQNLEAALIAQDAGADRIELCTELGLGGITPSIGLIGIVKKQLSIPIHVLVRPRAGDFRYSTYEFEAMIEDIKAIKELGAAGIVIGMLDEDATINTRQLERVREETRGIHLTFHRAFDLLPDPIAGFVLLEEMGVDTLLTSGQRKQAIDGMPLLQELHACPSSIMVMPGGGMHPTNIEAFKKAGFEAIHFSGTAQVAPAASSQPGKRLTYSDLGSIPQLRIQPDEVFRMIQSVK